MTRLEAVRWHAALGLGARARGARGTLRCAEERVGRRFWRGAGVAHFSNGGRAGQLAGADCGQVVGARPERARVAAERWRVVWSVTESEERAPVAGAATHNAVCCVRRRRLMPTVAPATAVPLAWDPRRICGVHALIFAIEAVVACNCRDLRRCGARDHTR